MGRYGKVAAWRAAGFPAGRALNRGECAAGVGIGLRLSQDLPRHRCDVALAEGQELQQVRDRVPFGPPEIRMRWLARAIADEQQQGASAFGTAGLLQRRIR